MAAAQLEPDIELDPAIECWYHSDFPMLTALVDPGEEIVRSRLYFRCSSYPDYYFVDLQADNGGYTGVAPQAEESCPAVHYYVEALTRDYTSARTIERVADVSSHTECRRRNPAAALFPGNDPRILLGSTVAGPQMAPGFKTLGISAFLSSTGATVAATSAGGTSTALIVGGVAAAAGGATAAVLATGSDDPAPLATAPPTSAPPPPPVGGGPAPPPPSAPQDVKACVRFEPLDAIIDVNQPLTIDARCSDGGAGLEYIFDLGDGRIKRGQPFITAVWTQPGTYTMVLTVRRAATSSVPGNPARLIDEDVLTRAVRVRAPFVAPSADFQWEVFDTEGGCHLALDGTISGGDIDTYDWLIDVNADFDEVPIPAMGAQVVQEWFSPCYFADGPILVRLTTTGPGGTDTIEKLVDLYEDFYENLQASRRGPIRFTSELMAAPGTKAQIRLASGPAQPVMSGAPVQHSITTTPSGPLIIEGVLLDPLQGPALWRFDLSRLGLAPGKVRVVAGQLAGRDDTAVLIRLTGRAGERIRLELELR